MVKKLIRYLDLNEAWKLKKYLVPQRLTTKSIFLSNGNVSILPFFWILSLTIELAIHIYGAPMLTKFGKRKNHCLSQNVLNCHSQPQKYQFLIGTTSNSHSQILFVKFSFAKMLYSYSQKCPFLIRKRCQILIRKKCRIPLHFIIECYIQ